MFHRVDMHAMLMSAACGEGGDGIPAKLEANHRCTSIDVESGEIVFGNGVKKTHDLIIGADGIGVSLRRYTFLTPILTLLPVSCA